MGSRVSSPAQDSGPRCSMATTGSTAQNNLKSVPNQFCKMNSSFFKEISVQVLDFKDTSPIAVMVFLTLIDGGQVDWWQEERESDVGKHSWICHLSSKMISWSALH